MCLGRIRILCIKGVVVRCRLSNKLVNWQR